MITTEAWVIHRGPDRDDNVPPAELRLEPFSFPDIEENEVLAEPIYGCWEGNMTHALERRPVDVCRQRGEARVVVGNSGVVRVLAAGAAVRNVKEGDLCRIFGNASWDAHGYTVKAHAYDAPGTIGVLAKRMKVDARVVAPLPPGTRHSLKRWSAFSARYVTAWANWTTAYQCYRIQMPEEEAPNVYVFGWGGGTTLGELALAKLLGCDATMMATGATRLDLIHSLGIRAIDRKTLVGLDYDEPRYATDTKYRARYQAAEKAFVEMVADVTRGAGASIFIDNIGQPVFRATLKALGRQGVVATAGWKLGMRLSSNRALECINRHIHVHTHFARAAEGEAAAAFAEARGWLPPVDDDKVYAWDEVPLLAERFASNAIESYFPLFAVNPL